LLRPLCVTGHEFFDRIATERATANARKHADTLSGQVPSEPAVQDGSRVAAEWCASLFPPLSVAPHVSPTAHHDVLASEPDQFRHAQTGLDRVRDAMAQDRLVAALSGFFGGLALLLAGMGLYGVTSYAVTRRRAELGIRMALGAAPRLVIRLVLARVSALVGAGVVVGIVLALATARFVTALLYGLEPGDPATLVGAAITLVAVGTVAGWLPAYRASRTDPAEVLRET
jgi:predicted lysophospholipase L1 biosynthesis ABC-type transport system permease subunit